MQVVASWTGGRADALRQALRMTNESFAGHLGVAVRTVAYWRERPEAVPRPAMQEILDTALARSPDLAQAQFSLILSTGKSAVGPTEKADHSDDLAGLTEWITSSNASDRLIDDIAAAVDELAARHTQASARPLLTDVRAVHRQIRTLLRGGRQRLRQTRELIRADGAALAHASVLLGDLGLDLAAETHGRAAATMLEEAGAGQAIAMYALAKTARWQNDYAVAADLARQGFEHGPLDPASVQLAYYEANSAALLGDRYRARDALARADRIAEALPTTGQTGSPWSFPAERQAIFRLSVLLRTGDSGGALAAAQAAEDGWRAGDPYIPGTWAQVRVGAALAHLQQDALDGATEQAAEVLTLAPEFRIATVTGWLADLDRQLARQRFASAPAAVSLRQDIREFQVGALPPGPKEAG